MAENNGTKTEETAIQVSAPNSVTDTYGTRDAIKEMVDYIRASLPGMQDVPEVALRGGAIIANAHGLDIFTGEVWIIVHRNKDQSFKSASLMAGVKGLRKAARRQLAKGYQYYTDDKPILPGSDDWVNMKIADHRDQWGNEPDLVYKCNLRRQDTTDKYLEQLERYCALGIPYEEAKEMAGPRPIYVGIGIVYKNTKSKMDLVQLARKRAESEALKKAFDLPFMTEGNPDSDEVVEAEYTEIDDKPKLTVAELRKNNETLYGDEDFEGFETTPEKDTTTEGVIVDDFVDVPPTKENAFTDQEPKPALEVVKKEAPKQDIQAAVKQAAKDKAIPARVQGNGTVERVERPYSATLIKSKLDTSRKNDPQEECSTEQSSYIASLMSDWQKDRLKRLSVLTWLLDREIFTTKDLTKVEAHAVINWLRKEEENIPEGESHLSEDAKQELERCYREALKAEGQLELIPEDAPHWTTIGQSKRSEFIKYYEALGLTWGDVAQAFDNGSEDRMHFALHNFTGSYEEAVALVNAYQAVQDAA